MIDCSRYTVTPTRKCIEWIASHAADQLVCKPCGALLKVIEVIVTLDTFLIAATWLVEDVDRSNSLSKVSINWWDK